MIPMIISNMAGGYVAIRHGLRGPNLCHVSACATGAHSIGEAARIIERGDADAMLAGGTEAANTKLGVAGFSAMRALSSRNDDPQAASRPFDRDRDGFVMGEGAAVLVLEEAGHAGARARRGPSAASASRWRTPVSGLRTCTTSTPTPPAPPREIPPRCGRFTRSSVAMPATSRSLRRNR